MKKIIALAFVSFIITSCFKEIDTVPLERTIEKTFTVQNSIKNTQTFYRLYETSAVVLSENSPSIWDLAFESAGNQGRVLSNYARQAITIKSGKFNIDELTQGDIINLIPSDRWMFDDPAYTNFKDSLSLKDWENGEVYVLKRGTNDENDYYKIQFVEKTDAAYVINYSKATESTHQTATIRRTDGLAYVYFSFNTNATVVVEPLITSWHLMFTPYYGWYETLTPGEYSPYNLSGILINYEGGVEVAQIFDANIDFEDIDESYIAKSNFTDWKGAIGSNWKLLGNTDAENLYTMDPDKKYLVKVFDQDEGVFKYFKLRIIDYKLNGEDHHPTVEFKFLANE